MAGPQNIDDPNYLAELAFKTVLQLYWCPAIPGASPKTVYITGDLDQQIHPCVTVKSLGAEPQLDPSVGIYKVRIQLDLKQKLDKQDAEVSERELRSVRQCFYRNDLTSRGPMQNLAMQLSASTAQLLTVMGVVPTTEIQPAVESDNRVLTRSLAFDVYCTPNR